MKCWAIVPRVEVIERYVEFRKKNNKKAGVKNFCFAELSRLTGLSKAFYSRLKNETNVIVPGNVSMAQMAVGMGLGLDELFKLTLVEQEQVSNSPLYNYKKYYKVVDYEPLSLAREFRKLDDPGKEENIFFEKIKKIKKIA